LWALRLALGELGDSMVPGQKIAPAAALAAGYAFETPTLEQSSNRSEPPGAARN
jgi:NAD dependent epimerase/dehydratase family enzyme